jgi:hypothetical protein
VIESRTSAIAAQHLVGVEVDSMPFSDIAQVRIVGSLQGQRCINVLHFASETVINDATELDTLLLELANAMLQCVVDTLLPAVTSDYTLLRIDVKSLFGVDNPEASVQPEGAAVGALSPVSASLLASLVNIKTAGGGKRGRGKIFLPPCGEAEMTSSSIDPGTVTLIIAFLTCVAGKFIGANKTTSWFFGVFSKKNLQAPGGNMNTAFRKATTMTVNSTVAKMGSRKKGVGA